MLTQYKLHQVKIVAICEPVINVCPWRLSSSICIRVDKLRNTTVSRFSTRFSSHGIRHARKAGGGSPTPARFVKGARFVDGVSTSIPRKRRDFTSRHQGGGLGIFLFVAIRELYSSFGGCILYFICFLLLRVTSQSAGKAPSAHGVGCC